MGQQGWGWQHLAREVIVGQLTDDLRGFVDLPPINIFTTFGVNIPVHVAGTVEVFLRFGLTEADATGSALGLDFPVSAAAPNNFLTQSVDWGGAGAEDPPGNPNSILPPRVAIRITTPAGSDFTYDLFGACLLVP